MSEEKKSDIPESKTGIVDMSAEKGPLEEPKKNLTGIPEAKFVEDVDAFMALDENSGGAEKVLKKLDEQHSKYKFMEFNLMSKRRRLKAQIPDLENSLKMITLLKKKRASPDLDTEFLLSEQVYMKATIPSTEKVCLWLGANVMLEYDLDDAMKLLENSVDTAKANLHSVETSLDFLRDQFTTTEVNMARVFNWDVKRRHTSKAAA